MAGLFLLNSNMVLVCTFGRFQPPTRGHEVLCRAVADTAKRLRADHRVFLSARLDAGNSLSWDERRQWLVDAAPWLHVDSDRVTTIPDIYRWAAKHGYEDVVWVIGSDRTLSFRKLLLSVAPERYGLKTIRLVDPIRRDPSSPDVAGISASAVRDAVQRNDYASFAKWIWTDNSPSALERAWSTMRSSLSTLKQFRTTAESVIKDAWITEGVMDPAIFKAVFLAGGPGSGKDYFKDRVLRGFGLREINSDIAFTFLMKRTGLSLAMPDHETTPRDAVRGVAKRVTAKMEVHYIEGRLGLIINSTGSDVVDVLTVKRKLEALGYDTLMIFVDTPDKVSYERNQARERKVPETIRSAKWAAAQRAKTAYQTAFGENFWRVDNSIDERTAPADEVRRKRQMMDTVWKHVRKFVSKPVSRPAAREWIDQQMGRLRHTIGEEAGKSESDKSETERLKPSQDYEKEKFQQSQLAQKHDAQKKDLRKKQKTDVLKQREAAMRKRLGLKGMKGAK